MNIEELKFDDQGLIPAIVQEASTGQVLMLAYMNRESLEKTLETGTTWFYSRSRQALWNKGATSGNWQQVKEIRIDCDQDALLVLVDQRGNACHTGSHSCFSQPLLVGEVKAQAEIGAVLQRLQDLIKDRRENPVEGSYTNYLLEKGIDKILKKVGEETTEVVIAAKNNSPEELTYEASDLLYHLTVLLTYQGLTYQDLAKELIKRQGR